MKVKNIKVKIFPTPEGVDKEAAKIVIAQILKKPNSVLGLPTGSTPLGMYANLVKTYREGEISFSKVTTFNLDEYYLIDPDHPSSYRQYMLRHFVNLVDLPVENFHIPVCQEYEELIQEAGGLDLTILGIGPKRTCHIGFNEHGTSFNSRTHLAELDSETIKTNRQYFKNPTEMPRQAITVGIETIMESKKIILLAKGGHKSEGIRLSLKGKVTEKHPASVLQRHPKVEFILDSEAASLL